MGYTRTTWVDGGAPAINAANLNKIEQGLVDAHTSMLLQSTSTSSRPTADPTVRVFFFTTTEPTAWLTGDIWWNLSTGVITPKA